MKSFCTNLCRTAFLLAAPVLSAATFNPIADFSLASNPNGVWAYGYSNTLSNLGTNFNLMNTANNCQTGLECWSFGILPEIARNTSGAPLSFLSVVIPTNELHLHPGQGGVYAILRWTAPTSDTYDISGAFTVQDVTARSVTLDIVGLGFSDSFVNQAWGSEEQFAYNQFITAGTNLYFAVGDAGEYSYDSTGLKLSITGSAVPEPGSMSMAAFGAFGGIALWVRRRRNR